MTSGKQRTSTVGWLVTVTFVLIAAVCAYALFSGWTTPFLSEKHGFRQAQTALTISTLLGGGSWLAYDTPVLGPPWSIPFEFPLYQWLVALIVKTGLLPLAAAARFVGITFFAVALFPFFRVLRLLEFSRSQSLAILCLLCSSAEYLFWTRTVMIEATALSLALVYLWLVLSHVKRVSSTEENRFLPVMGIALAGSLAATVKVTTFFPFFCAAAAVLVVAHYQRFAGDRARGLLSNVKRGYAIILCAAVIPVVALFSWTHYTDSLKMLNPLAVGLTSHSLSEWNFGSFQQKLSYTTWHKFYWVTVKDVLGNSSILPLSLMALLFCTARTRVLAVAALLFSFIHLATFTNLNLVHNYYAYAHGIFIVTAVGMVGADLAVSAQWWKKLLGTALFLLVITSSWRHYYQTYWPDQGHNPPYFTQMKQDIDLYTRPSDVVVVFGWDWSSEPAYYLQRRAVMLQNDFATAPFRAMRGNLNNYRIGAVMLLRRAPENPLLVNNVAEEFGLKPTDFYREYPEGVVFYSSGRAGRF